MTIDKSSHIPFRRRLDTRPVKPRLTLAETHWKLGKALALREKWSEAAIELRQAIALDNDWLEPQRELARVLVKLSAWDEAAGVLRGVAEESPEDSQTRHLLGDALSKLERWEEAVEAYRGAIALEPDFVWSHNNLGDALRQLERWEEAAEAYQKAIALEPDFVWSHNNLGDALFKLERWDEAAEAYQNAIALDKDSLILQRNLGKVLVKLSAWEEAVTLWQQVAEKSPNDSEVWHLLGDALSGSERWSEAVAAYQNAIGLNPEFSGSHNNLGDALLKLERWSEAVAAYQNAIGLNPEFFWSHNNLGDALLKLERWSEAAEAYQNAIGLNPEFFWSHNNLGDALLKLERWSEAAEAYQNAIELKPDFALSHHNLGDILVKKEDWEGAIAAFRQGVAINPQAPWSLYKLGQLLRQQGEFEEAVGYLRQAIALQADVPEFYLGLGAVLVKLGQSSEAEDYLYQVIQFPSTSIPTTDSAKIFPVTPLRTPDLAEAYYYLGSAKSQQQQWSEAVEFYRRSLEINPNGGDCCLGLAEALGKLGQWSESVEFYRQAVLLSRESGEALFSLGQALGQLQRWVGDVKLSKELGSELEQIGDSQGEIPSYQKQLTPKLEPKIILFMPYYKATQSERQDEFIYCLKRNIQCSEIEKIVLIVDDNHVPELEHPKIEIVKIATRPTYLDWVELTKKKCPDQISLLANTDIYFDESVSRLREIFSANPKAFVAISRYEQENINQILHENPHWSQDVWAIYGEYNFTESFKNNLKIPLGVPRCDNKIAYLFAIHGAKVYNPCQHIKTVHVHETQLRNYDKYGDTTILGGIAWVYPGVVIDEPSKLQIELWSLNASDLTGVTINKTWGSLKPTPKEQAKVSEMGILEKSCSKKSIHNVIAFDSDWQYPAITEKYAYEMANKFLIQPNYNRNVVYFGFPWSTLIDESIHNKADQTRVNALIEKLISFKSELKKYKRIITVCQHIRMLECENIFHEVGITDIFWSHTIKDQNVLPSYPEISLHPFPLYPVQAIDIQQTETEKKYLYSFVGTHAKSSYLTESRNQIIDYLSSDDRGLIIIREEWHYNKIVYDHQILKRVKETEGLVDQSASEEFKEVMKQSVFALCPSGSGPNSIRLWEAIGFGVIPVVLADTYLPPGDLTLWHEAIVMCPETLEDIKALPDRLAKMQKDDQLLKRKRDALKQLWMRYGSECFVYDIVKLFFKYASGDMTVPPIKTTSSKALKKGDNVLTIASKKLKKEDFKPSYTWPNQTFPFRLYYDSPKCRIFIIENIQHNWNWMAECHQHFRKTDFFFVMAGWYQSPSFADEAEKIFSVLNLDKTQFFLMYNSPLEMLNFSEKGFQGDVINKNAWLNENEVMQPMESHKMYDAIYVDFENKSKRPLLAAQVSRLALVTRANQGKVISEIPPNEYINDRQLLPEEVCEKINQAHCGLILSAEEGACLTSSEYLLCGIPVVSTTSRGGRDVWYNEYNSIVCDPTPDAVAFAVEKFVRNPPDAQRIRQRYIEQAEDYRAKFIQVVADVFNRFGVVDVDPLSYFKKNFYHRMRKSENIKFVKSLFY
ncbi:tetratricopeptide repeat protein [Limnospira sp. PMC 1042.18]|uniref:tetratricopeptide repeat protein n=1 Tax=Limnospira sp. PMC 1042.18 TaxID=2981018 RepID=UPI0028E152E1|nr:tetratricopeptide repeat protein [Limnospira sp. PMC 1042.18]MDT9199436.1 tetratricopeptide repeat protein [Limnospira sp. PMC 1042.18]